jgi:hypothetical protein
MMIENFTKLALPELPIVLVLTVVCVAPDVLRTRPRSLALKY